MIIDCQWHWVPEAFLQVHIGRPDYARCIRSDGGYVYEVSADEVWDLRRPEFYDLDVQVSALDAAGIDAAVVSPSCIGDVNDRDRSEAKELCILLNEEMSRAQTLHPGRFYGLAMLPLADTGDALDVLDDAIRRLKLRGVLLVGNANGTSVADPHLWPLYARLEELRVPIFLHPTRCFRGPLVTPYGLEIPIGYMFDTSIAAMSLILSGVIDRYPDLKVVHPHVGGTLPYLHGRIEVYRLKGFWPNLDRPIVEYFRGLYFDTVCNEVESLVLVQDVIGADRLLFSSDFPFWPAHDGIEIVRRCVTGEHVDGVLGNHARELLAVPRDMSETGG